MMFATYFGYMRFSRNAVLQKGADEYEVSIHKRQEIQQIIYSQSSFDGTSYRETDGN